MLRSRLLPPYANTRLVVDGGSDIGLAVFPG
jgi:hypothetical protein